MIVYNSILISLAKTLLPVGQSWLFGEYQPNYVAAIALASSPLGTQIGLVPLATNGTLKS